MSKLNKIAKIILVEEWETFYKKLFNDYTVLLLPYKIISKNDEELLKKLLKSNSADERLKIIKDKEDKLSIFISIGLLCINIITPGNDYSRESMKITRDNSVNIYTNSGRYYFALELQWNKNLGEKEGWKKNKGGLNNKSKFKFLLKNNNLLNFLEESNDVNLNGIQEIIKNEKKGFIELINKLIKSENYPQRAYYLYLFLGNYIYKYGEIPIFYTYGGEEGTIFSPLYSIYYELNKKNKKTIDVINETNKKSESTKSSKELSKPAPWVKGEIPIRWSNYNNENNLNIY
jgi:hypothetical protein